MLQQFSFYENCEYLPSNNGVPPKSIAFRQSKLLVPTVVSIVFSPNSSLKQQRSDRRDKKFFICIYYSGICLWLLIKKKKSICLNSIQFSQGYLIRLCNSFSCCHTYFRISNQLMKLVSLLHMDEGREREMKNIDKTYVEDQEAKQIQQWWTEISITF